MRTAEETRQSLPLVARLSKDLRQGARGLGMMDARYLVDTYYAVQKLRIAIGNRKKASERSGEPSDLTDYLEKQLELLEKYTATALGEFADAHPLGQWLKTIVGIGPVLSAGLISRTWEYDFKTVSALWRFAGLDPTLKWERGQKRPFNAALKTLCFRIGESFVKFQSHPESVYGKLFTEIKKEEWERNINGKYSEAAKVKASQVAKDTSSYLWYSGQVSPTWVRQILESEATWPEKPPKSFADGQPMLPPAHIHARARRRVVKIFLSHLWEVSYWLRKGVRPEDPWIIAHGGHTHKIEVPNAPWQK